MTAKEQTKDDKGRTLVKMTQADIDYHATWRAASGHPTGKWRVCRQLFDGRGLQTLCDRRGRDILFHTYEAAERRAKIKLSEERVESADDR